MNEIGETYINKQLNPLYLQEKQNKYFFLNRWSFKVISSSVLLVVD